MLCHRRLFSCEVRPSSNRILSKFRTVETAAVIRRRTYYYYYYHDPTLSWAKENPHQAQRCLQPPGWDLKNCDPVFLDAKTESLESYCKWRKWLWHQQQQSSSPLPPPPLPHEHTLLSHVLSAPLTLANFYIKCGFSKGKRKTRLCCVGARAEANLPLDYWKEFLLQCTTATTDLGQESSSPIQVSMDFVGPDIQSNTSSKTISVECGSSIEIRWHYAGLLHEIDDVWDAYVFFNPGLGHPNLCTSWAQTLERVVQEKRPILFTAHSYKDAERDYQCLVEYGLDDVQYSSNPFASRITYEDPFDKTHIVKPNHYSAHALISSG